MPVFVVSSCKRLSQQQAQQQQHPTTQTCRQTRRRNANINSRTNVMDMGMLQLYGGTCTVTTHVTMVSFFFDMQNKTYSTDTQPFRQSPQPQQQFPIPTSMAWYVCKMASITHADLFKQPMNKQQQLEQAPHNVDNNCDNEYNNNNGNETLRHTPPQANSDENGHTNGL